MPVAPELVKLLEAINTQPQMHQLPLEQLRMPRERIGGGAFQPVAQVEDLAIPGPGGPIPLRLYQPEDDAGELPLVLVIPTTGRGRRPNFYTGLTKNGQEMK